MDLFTDGEDVEYTFATDLGRIAAIAVVRVQGDTLILEDVAFYPLTVERMPVGTRAILQMARTVEQLARLQGFTDVILRGKRFSGAKPGRSLFLQRRIR